MENKINLKFNTMAIILIVIFAICITSVSLQNDTFYSIKIGEYIIQNGITMKDPFSWHENLPYTYPHWAYDVIVYLIYSIRWLFRCIYCNCNFSCNFGISNILYKCKTYKKQFTIFHNYSSKSSTSFIYFIYINGIFYRKIFRNKAKTLCSRTIDYSNNNSKRPCRSMAVLFCSIYAIYSGIYNFTNSKYRCILA